MDVIHFALGHHRPRFVLGTAAPSRMETSRQNVLQTLDSGALTADTCPILQTHFVSFPDDTILYRGLETRLQTVLPPETAGVDGAAPTSEQHFSHRLVSDLLTSQVRVLVQRCWRAVCAASGASQSNDSSTNETRVMDASPMHKLLRFARTAALGCASQASCAIIDWLHGEAAGTTSPFNAGKVNDAREPHNPTQSETALPTPPMLALRALLRCMKTTNHHDALRAIVPDLGILLCHLGRCISASNTASTPSPAVHTTYEWLKRDVSALCQILSKDTFSRDAAGANCVKHQERLRFLVNIYTLAFQCADVDSATSTTAKSPVSGPPSFASRVCDTVGCTPPDSVKGKDSQGKPPVASRANAWSLDLLKSCVPTAAAAFVATPGASNDAKVDNTKSTDKLLLSLLEQCERDHKQAVSQRTDAPDLSTVLDTATISTGAAPRQLPPRCIQDAIQNLVVEIDAYLLRHAVAIRRKNCKQCRDSHFQMMRWCMELLRTLLSYAAAVNEVDEEGERYAEADTMNIQDFPSLCSLLRLVCGHTRLMSTLLRLCEHYGNLVESPFLRDEEVLSTVKSVLVQMLMCTLVLASGVAGNQLGSLWASARTVAVESLLPPPSWLASTAMPHNPDISAADHIDYHLPRLFESVHNTKSVANCSPAAAERLSIFRRQLMDLHAFLNRRASLKVSTRVLRRSRIRQTQETKLNNRSHWTSASTEVGSTASVSSPVSPTAAAATNALSEKNFSASSPSSPTSFDRARSSQFATAEPNTFSLTDALWEAVIDGNHQPAEEAAYILLKLLLVQAPAEPSSQGPLQLAVSNTKAGLICQRLQDRYSKGALIASGVFGAVYVGSKTASVGSNKRTVAIKEVRFANPMRAVTANQRSFCDTICSTFAEICALLRLRNRAGTNRLLDFGLVDAPSNAVPQKDADPSSSTLQADGQPGKSSAATSPPVPQTGACVWLVMEHGRESLKAWRARKLKCGTPVSLSSILRIFLRVCSAVAECHRAGVTHYDIKCDNVLVKGASTPRATFSTGGFKSSNSTSTTSGIRRTGSGGHAQQIRELKAMKEAAAAAAAAADSVTTSTDNSPQSSGIVRSASNLSFFKTGASTKSASSNIAQNLRSTPENAVQHPNDAAAPRAEAGSADPTASIGNDKNVTVDAEDVQVSLIDFGEARIRSRFVRRNYFHRGTECIRSPEMLLMEGTAPQPGSQSSHRHHRRRGGSSRNRFRHTWDTGSHGGSHGGSSFGSTGSDSLYDVLEESTDSIKYAAMHEQPALVESTGHDELASESAKESPDSVAKPEVEKDPSGSAQEHGGTSLDSEVDAVAVEEEGDSIGGQDDDNDEAASHAMGTGVASDVWSLGCLLFELATGEFLFADADWARFYQRVTGEGFGGWRRTTPTHAGVASAPGSSLQLIRLSDKQLLQERCGCTKEQADFLAKMLETHFLVRDPAHRASIAQCQSVVASTLSSLQKVQE